MPVIDQQKIESLVLNEFPTPIAMEASVLYDELFEVRPLNIKNIFNTTVLFIGNVLLANYLEEDVDSTDVNLFLVSSLKNMNTSSWINLINLIIPVLKNKIYIRKLGTFYRNVLCDPEGILQWFNRFTERVKVDYLPVDEYEINEARKKLTDYFSNIEFLKDVSLFTVTERGLLELKGVNPKEVQRKKSYQLGSVYLQDNEAEKTLRLNLLARPADNKWGLKFNNFLENRKDYKKVMQTKNLKQEIAEYRNLLGGKPRFEKKELFSFDDLPLGGLQEQLTDAIEGASRKILVESYPGGGKTLLVAGFERLFDISDFVIAKYYLEGNHLLSSTTLFSRFFYRQLNNCLEQPYPVYLEGKAWADFKARVSRDFVLSNKKLLLIVDSIEYGFKTFSREKTSIEEFLSYDFPGNLTILMTTRIGYYPRKFDLKIKIPDLTSNETEEFFADSGIPLGKIEELNKFYGGQRGYLMDFMGDRLIQLDKIPERIIENFKGLLYRYNFFNPVREKIIRCIADNKRAISLNDIAGHIKIPAPIVLQHLNEIHPILRIQRKEEIFRYSLFIPAFADFIRNWRIDSL
ncbi:MAG: hypothetical protein ACLFQV_05540 [Vulcanimicrobiota bacterium]